MNLYVKRTLIGFLILISPFIFLYLSLFFNWFGERPELGTIDDSSAPYFSSQQSKALEQEKVILFGDLHVHTTYSLDAFLGSLPILEGEGVHPVADACNFSRFCANLDFFSVTDHAEFLTRREWEDTIESLQSCSRISKTNDQEEIVPFLGWEWTQEGGFGQPHYGHKNIILKDLDEDKIPARPIASPQVGFANMPFSARFALSSLKAFDGRVQDLMTYARDGETIPCPSGVDVQKLPSDCKEYANNPGELFDKLNQWGHDAVVIPHGTAWGTYTPPEADWKNQLTDEFHDPNFQTLIEVYSGHGNSELHRNWRSVLYDEEGQAICPSPSENFLPACWQAGVIIEERCFEEGESDRECKKRAKEARQNYANAGNAGQATVFKEDPTEWLDSNQCQDCFLPTFNMRPKGSAQYILALRNFNPDDTIERFKFGFIGSSDTHSARPGNGYKDINRIDFTDAAGPTESVGFIFGFNEGEGIYGKSTPKIYTKDNKPSGPIEVDRVMSYFYTGGLIATHSEDKSRDSIWRSIKNKEVYATSGPRILLWFDLVNSDEGILPMGSETSLKSNPRFIVKALGSLEQKPGCPDYAVNALGKERLALLCKNECYNPSDIRREIDRIEIIKIIPQQYQDEKLDDLIMDPWKSFKCNGTEECFVTFTDSDFETQARDALYYARAIEKESKAVNAGNLRCEVDAFGQCKEVNICYGSPIQNPREEDCLANTQERAWSSPIFVDYKKY